ncbi:hypothetical protein M409DRAFT_15658 [Zasmidium cellare ATCC 36951]|uniref:Carbohydrate kinase PfkB domain-containing protein n=1 Tax=Zasmidium cellare ATCC 36951 TaxID=1080233 RepID=A0A6A6D2P6_ZASCE|nr:uncharacterized protein M409DRAFT_15658 [Zasmidium cellare ATCC 36951]KAF2173373.1 hypothetical protein M409DRAFT_15658 [Zasmidium cellare ATCC 36951]
MASTWTCRACRSAWRSSRLSKTNPILRRSLSTNSKFFKVSEEILQAIAEKRPVVALETTIYTHGFPYPDNVALSTKLESLVRENGGVPATIGILDGVARVGLDSKELDQLVSSPGSPNVWKLSRRDLGFVLGMKDAEGKPLNGGTTISGTSVLAHMAGIKIFATGGLGGVHRGAELTMDVSADLTELGRTPITVISSGCKSFLDIPKTLEYLETQGVAVATFAAGRTGSVDFPAFYARDSGVKSPVVLRDEIEAARVIFAQNSLGLQSGLHFANPIPDKFSVPFQEMEKAIAEALEAASAAGSKGAAITPFILDKIKEVTGSRSVEANRALVEANVIRGTKVAVELRKLEQEGSAGDSHSVMTGPAAASFTNEGVPKSFAAAAQQLESEPRRDGAADQVPLSETRADVFVAGSLAVDLACDFSPRPGSRSQSPELQTSNPARIAQSLGGVGHNVARAAHLMGANVRLCSAVGDDLTGKAALEALSAADMSTVGVKTLSKDSGSRTAQYIAVNDKNKDLVLAMADMSILETPSSLSNALANTFDDFWLPQLHACKPSHLAIDGNWSPGYLARWLQAGKDINAHITFEPVSNAKSIGIFNLPHPNTLSVFPSPSLHLATPNIHELSAMYTAARENQFFDREDWWTVIDALGIPQGGARVQLALATTPKLVDQGVPQQTIQLLPFIPTIVTKLGKQGVLLTQILSANDPRLSSGEYAPYILSRCANETESTLGVGGVYMRLFPAVEEVDEADIVSVNGVGDTFVGTLIAGLAREGNGEGRVEEFVDLAQRAAVLTLKSAEAVSPGLGTLGFLL